METKLLKPGVELVGEDGKPCEVELLGTFPDFAKSNSIRGRGAG